MGYDYLRPHDETRNRLSVLEQHNAAERERQRELFASMMLKLIECFSIIKSLYEDFKMHHWQIGGIEFENIRNEDTRNIYEIQNVMK